MNSIKKWLKRRKIQKEIQRHKNMIYRMGANANVQTEIGLQMFAYAIKDEEEAIYKLKKELEQL